MKSIILSIIWLSVTQGFALSAGMHTATATSEDIQITATAIVEDDQRTLIRCTLTNHSRHILASDSTRTPSKCFRFFCWDRNGNLLAMDKTWALRHSQPDGSNNGRIASKSGRQVVVLPGETSQFDFYLEDAYGGKAKEAELLEVKWFNVDPLPKGHSTLRIDELKNPDGTVLRQAREEANHFPGVRSFVAKLPLISNQSTEFDEIKGPKPKLVESESTDKSAFRSQPQEIGATVSRKPFDFRWLLLLLLPGLILVLRFLRSRPAR